MAKQKSHTNKNLSFEDFKKEVLQDYELANLSRQLSILGRKEVLTGKAKFGIFGDGKEIPQIAMAKFFKNGDWRSGYYRDQTFMLATATFTAEEFFAQLYGDTEIEKNPSNGGRSFNNHFGTRLLHENGSWKDLMKQKNSSADISPTSGQMPRLLGLAYASKLYRRNKNLHSLTRFSDKGNEVAFGTIGDASTSEGHFFETMNAAGVLQVPMAMSVWDDGYGISVPIEHQTTKKSISELLKGFEKNASEKGFYIFKEKAWNYPGLVKMYQEGIAKCRKEHVPVLFHVTEVTQPLGHSTSGSHERYKSKERLDWEKEYDCIRKMGEWMISKKIATKEELSDIEDKARTKALEAKKSAWKSFTAPIKKERDALVQIIENKTCVCKREKYDKTSAIANELKRILNPIRKDNFSAAKKLLRHVCMDCSIREELQANISAWLQKIMKKILSVITTNCIANAKNQL